MRKHSSPFAAAGENQTEAHHWQQKQPLQLHQVHSRGHFSDVMTMSAWWKAMTLEAKINWYMRVQLIGAFYEVMHIILRCYGRSGWVPLASTTWCIYDWNQFSKWNIYVTNFSEVVRVHEFAGCRSSAFDGSDGTTVSYCTVWWKQMYLWKINLIYELISDNMSVCQILSVCGQQPFRQSSNNTLRWIAHIKAGIFKHKI